MAIPVPLAQNDGVPVKRFVQTSITAIGSSPLSSTFTIPEQGSYLAHIIAYEWNPTFFHAWISANIVWYKPASSPSGVFVAKTVAGSFATNNAEITNLTVSDPSSSGVVTVTITDSRAGSHTSQCKVVLFQMLGPYDVAFS